MEVNCYEEFGCSIYSSDCHLNDGMLICGYTACDKECCFFCDGVDKETLKSCNMMSNLTPEKSLLFIAKLEKLKLEN